MSVTYVDGSDATQSGDRIVLPDRPEPLSPEPLSSDTPAFYRRATSKETRKFVEAEAATGRSKWAQLSIEMDGELLAFWLPEELEMYCEVFAMKPFPTALTVLKRSPPSTQLNAHWLSRLPKKVKSPKFRERFLHYVNSRPPELVEFYKFYNRTPGR